MESYRLFFLVIGPKASSHNWGSLRSMLVHFEDGPGHTAPGMYCVPSSKPSPEGHAELFASLLELFARIIAY